VPFYEHQYDGYVYLAQRPDGITKIGHSKNPQQRVIMLNSKYRGIRLVRAMKTNLSRGFEHLLHQRFSEYHVRTEWFALPESELEAVRWVSQVRIKADVIAQMYASNNPFSCICYWNGRPRKPRPPEES
jgi:hypothetical protein